MQRPIGPKFLHRIVAAMPGVLHRKKLAKKTMQYFVVDAQQAWYTSCLKMQFIALIASKNALVTIKRAKKQQADSTQDDV